MPERPLFAASRSRIRWGWLSMIALAATSAAIYVCRPSIGASIKSLAFGHGHSEKQSVTFPTLPQKPASAADASDMASERVATVSAPARVESIEPAPIRAASAVAGSSADPFAALASATPATPASAAPAASAVITPVVAPVQKSAAKRVPIKVLAKPTKPHADDAKRHTAVAHTARPSEREATRANKGTTGRDPDVDLLAALMAHAAGRSGANPTASSREAPKSIDEPSIAKLVKRCENLNGEDALQCQRRMCDGYWGKAQACPARVPASRE